MKKGFSLPGWIGLIFLMLFVCNKTFAQQNDTFTDGRDGKLYHFVKIGTTIWMSENLNFKTKRSYCYGDLQQNCTTYGRLYTWDAAMKACPAGWHLPSQDEWSQLVNALGGSDNAGAKMKMVSSKWRNQQSTDNNSSGFSILPAGRIANYDNYNGLGYYAFIWTSTEYIDNAWYVSFSCNDSRIIFGANEKISGFSCRCVKD